MKFKLLKIKAKTNTDLFPQQYIKTHGEMNAKSIRTTVNVRGKSFLIKKCRRPTFYAGKG